MCLINVASIWLVLPSKRLRAEVKSGLFIMCAFMFTAKCSTCRLCVCVCVWVCVCVCVCVLCVCVCVCPRSAAEAVCWDGSRRESKCIWCLDQLQTLRNSPQRQHTHNTHTQRRRTHTHTHTETRTHTHTRRDARTHTPLFLKLT